MRLSRRQLDRKRGYAGRWVRTLRELRTRREVFPEGIVMEASPESRGSPGVNLYAAEMVQEEGGGLSRPGIRGVDLEDVRILEKPSFCVCMVPRPNGERGCVWCGQEIVSAAKEPT